MKIATTILVIFVTITLGYSQSAISETFTTNDIDQIVFDVKYGDVIFETGNQEDILITGSALINFGKHNEWFKLKTSREGNVLKIEGWIENEDKIEMEITLYQDDEVTKIKGGKSWEESHDIIAKQFPDTDFQMTSMRKAIEVQLKVVLPKSMDITTYTEFGDVVLSDLKNPIQVYSKHGSITASYSESPSHDMVLESKHDFVELRIPRRTKAQVTLESRHGVIYTNFEQNEMKLDDRSVSEHAYSGILNNGNKVKCYIQAKHDNIYLRGT